MGLDITHIKATLERPRTTSPYGMGEFTEEKFDGFDVPFSHFEKYIQEIDCPKVVKSVILVTDNNNLDYTLEWFKKSQQKVVFEKTASLLEKKLKDYESKNGLNSLCKYVDESPQKWHLIEYYEMNKKNGFYTVNEGYQRKGMNSDFSYFYQENKDSFVLEEDFIRAYNCIDYYWDSDTEEDVINRRKTFKEDFLDKFEFGASFMELCY